MPEEGVTNQQPTPHMFDEFLNPRSMLTPGAAGAFVLMLSLTLHRVLDPVLKGVALDIGLIAFVLSFLLGLLQFNNSCFTLHGIHIWARPLYYIFNSLMILALATGTLAMTDKTVSLNSELLDLKILNTSVYAQTGPLEGAQTGTLEQERSLSSTLLPSRQRSGGGGSSLSSDGFRLDYTVTEKERGPLEDLLVVTGLAEPIYQLVLKISSHKELPEINKVVYSLDSTFGDENKVTVDESGDNFQLILDQVWMTPHVDVQLLLTTDETINLSGDLSLDSAVVYQQSGQ